MELEEIQQYVQNIIDDSLLVVVEGKKDRRALEELGVTRIVELEAYYMLVEKIDEKEIVLLVDLDKEGKRIYGKLKDLFSRRGVRVNDDFRHFLFKKTTLRQIEGLTHYMASLRKVI